MDINVWLVNPAIAVATNKIRVHPDPLVHLARPVPMENTVPKEEKAKVERKVAVKDTNVHRHHPDAFNALPDPKDRTDLPVPPDLPVPKDNRVREVAMDTQALVPLVQLALPVLQEVMVIRVLVVITVPMPTLVAKALPAVKVKTAALVQPVLKETTVPLVIPALLVLLVLLEALAKPAKMEAKVLRVHPVNPAVMARMPNIVLALIAANLSTTLSKYARLLVNSRLALQNYLII